MVVDKEVPFFVHFQGQGMRSASTAVSVTSDEDDHLEDSERNEGN